MSFLPGLPRPAGCSNILFDHLTTRGGRGPGTSLRHMGRPRRWPQEPLNGGVSG